MIHEIPQFLNNFDSQLFFLQKSRNLNFFIDALQVSVAQLVEYWTGNRKTVKFCFLEKGEFTVFYIANIYRCINIYIDIKHDYDEKVIFSFTQAGRKGRNIPGLCMCECSGKFPYMRVIYMPPEHLLILKLIIEYRLYMNYLLCFH